MLNWQPMPSVEGEGAEAAAVVPEGEIAPPAEGENSEAVAPAEHGETAALPVYTGQ